MKKHLISLALLFMTTLNANASVILGGTRVIYEGNKKEASLQ
ncbi:molecular chaperone [Providencia rettgeri]|nr:molecular chaperone [Providencia rettgeri]